MTHYSEGTENILKGYAREMISHGWTEDATAMLAIAKHGRVRALGITSNMIHGLDALELSSYLTESLPAMVTYETYEDFATLWDGGYYHEAIRVQRFAAVCQALGLLGYHEHMATLGRTTARLAQERGSWVYGMDDVYNWIGGIGNLTGVTVFNACPGNNREQVYGGHVWHTYANEATRKCAWCVATQL